MSGDIWTDAAVHHFTDQELARLAIYRAAVRAGYYNEGATATAPARGRAGAEAVRPSAEVRREG